MEKIEKRLVIQGRVQGVGFRFFTAMQAKKHKLTGTVQNCADKSVEIYCNGTESDINQFIESIRKGPPLSRVDKVQIEECPPKEYNDFSII